MIKDFFQTKQTLQKFHSCLFCELKLITVLLLICNPCRSWTSAMFIPLKLCVGFPIFDPILFLEWHNSLQNKNNKKKSLTFLLLHHWVLSYNKEFENSVISGWVGALKKLILRWTFSLYKIEVLKCHFFSVVTFKHMFVE